MHLSSSFIILQHTKQPLDSLMSIVPESKDFPVYIDVGAVYTTPGPYPSLGPTRIEIVSGRIASLSPLSTGDLSSSVHQLLVLPALANAHDHGSGLPTLAYDAFDETLETWIATLSYQPDVDPYLAASVAYARMAQSGICATNHCHTTLDPERLLREAEAASRAARDVGIHVAFAVPFVERNLHVYGNVAKLLELLPSEDHTIVLDWVERLKTMPSETLSIFDQLISLEHDLFHVQYRPVGPQWIGDESLAAIAKLSTESGRRIHMHLLETVWQREWTDSEHQPEGIINRLDKMGILSPRLTLY